MVALTTRLFARYPRSIHRPRFVYACSYSSSYAFGGFFLPLPFLNSITRA